MVGFEYLHKGLCGLARAHQAKTLAGHLGAAVVAGYLFGEDQNDLPREVYEGIEKELDRIIRGEETVWFDPRQAGVTIPELFQPFGKERPQKELIPTIAEAVGQRREDAPVGPQRDLRGHRAAGSSRPSGLCDAVGR
ncbi:MAG: hypothetical protein ACYTG0_14790 [Planctomycetota bacterium]|jgi:hypothetical protein